MRLLLAPMEGLLDDVLRGVLSRAGGYDFAVTEFVRVSGTLLPPRYFRRVSPELDNGGCTAAGLPVRVQLLGSDPACMADNAARLARLRPPGIDLNFGCPAPTVNRHRGGAVLLDEPETLHAIAAAVRAAVPRGMPFTAKMRLGVDSPAKALDCARALVAGGVDELVVHARTRLDGYRPPAHWAWIARIAEAVDVPVVANGEVWCEDDWRRCVAESGVRDVMLGRGAVADPFLASRLRLAGSVAEDADGRERRLEREWRVLQALIGEFWLRVQQKVEPRHAPGRLKQWLGFLRRRYPQAGRLHASILPLRLPQDITPALLQHGVTLMSPALAA